MPKKPRTPTLNQAGARHDEFEDRGAAARARLLPRVTFGLGAAVLAGVVVTSPASAAIPGAAPVMTTATLGGAVSHLATGGDDTACCSF
jgi:hypothetical protein